MSCEMLVAEELSKVQNFQSFISELKEIAKNININNRDNSDDGRITSALKEGPFLNELKKIILENHPDWEVFISPPRASYDIIINNTRINLKLTDCKSADNCMNKPSIFYSITGNPKYPHSSTYNEFLSHLYESRNQNQIKKQRDRSTEYYYLVKNKLTGDVLLKSIFDIHQYVSNPSNDLQINWKHEFEYSEYYTDDSEYLKKVEQLLLCLQKSVKDKIERTKVFANANLSLLFES